MSQELNLWKRLQGETPKFFKRVIAYSVTLAAVGGALAGAELAIPGLILPVWLHTLAQNFLLAGIIGAAVSKTTVVNQSVMTNKYILDTANGLFLAIGPEDGGDRWVTGTLNAYQFPDQSSLDAKLATLNNGGTRYIGAGGVGTPK